MQEYFHVAHGSDDRQKDLMTLLNKSFGFETEDTQFLGLLPKLYKDEYHPAKSNLILDVGGDYRAAVGVYYNKLTVAGHTLTTGGIGNVCVAPEHRRKDYMKAAMLVAVDELKQNNTDISFLGGHRQRYNYFSYEVGGIRYELTLMRRNFRHMYGTFPELKAQVKELEESDEKLLDDITEIYERRSVKFERPRSAMLDILRSWHNRAFAVIDGGRTIGWFVSNDDATFFCEVGYDREEDIEKVLHAALCTSNEDGVSFAVAEYDVPLLEKLGVCGENFRVVPAEQFSILNYEPVIRAYLELKKTYTGLADGECVIYFEGIKIPEQLRISVKGGEVSVEEDFTSKPDLVLTQLEAARFLTAAFSEKRRLLKPECASWFPLPLYVPSPDAV